MADLGVGTIVSLVNLARGLYDKFNELGTDAKKLADSAEKLKKRLEKLGRSLRDNCDKISIHDILDLPKTFKKCHDAIRAADKTAEEMKSKWQKAKETVLRNDDIDKAQKEMDKCHNELLAVVFDQILEIVGSISDEQIRSRRTYPPLSETQIPEGAPDFAREILLSKDRDINEPDEHGYTALFYACESGDTELVEVLLQRGATMTLRTLSTKNTALHAVVDDDTTSRDSVGILIAMKKAIKDRLVQSPGKLETAGNIRKRSQIERRNHRINEEWLELVASVNKDWEMPLHVAAKYGRVDAVTVLLKGLQQSVYGGKKLNLINSPNHIGRTALHLAARNNKRNVVKVLLDHGADPSLKDSKGEKPFELAERKGHPVYAELARKQPVAPSDEQKGNKEPPVRQKGQGKDKAKANGNKKVVEKERKENVQKNCEGQRKKKEEGKFREKVVKQYNEAEEAKTEGAKGFPIHKKAEESENDGKKARRGKEKAEQLRNRKKKEKDMEEQPG